MVWTRAALAALRRHDVHVLADPRRVPASASGIGSSVGVGARARTLARPAPGAGLVPGGCCAPRMAWAAIMARHVAALLADRSVALRRARGSTSSSTSARCLWVVLPGAILWGASFPLALAAVARSGGDQARVVGGAVRRQHAGRHRRRARRRRAARGVDRQPAHAAVA
ncbi:MAG: hypothetical protein MZV64_28375 [Ignavibacteriales bacterium]|nr:hypothetical protein [Ignavibacteriales bacterium]